MSKRAGMYCMYVYVCTGTYIWTLPKPREDGILCPSLEKKKILPLVQIGPILLPMSITSSRDTNLKLGVSAISYIGAEGKYDQPSPTLMNAKSFAHSKAYRAMVPALHRRYPLLDKGSLPPCNMIWKAESCRDSGMGAGPKGCCKSDF